jgi:1-deoxy-D-xylulose-5-phosphate reductoisomerase
MGAKVTIDSATLVNKGLEVIEAHWLFGLPYEQIEVLIHAQSVIHSLVEYQDGSMLAQLGTPDMRLPIQYALAYPDRSSVPVVPRLNLSEIKNLTFQQPDIKTFRGLALAYEAGRAGGTMPAVFNVANEEAVRLFCAGEIKFTDIPDWIEKSMQEHQNVSAPSLEDILSAIEWARRLVAGE